MKRVLLALALALAATSAFAQPGPGYGRPGDRYRYLDPEVRAALRDYCRIKHRQHERNPAVAVPAICYRLFRGRP